MIRERSLFRLLGVISLLFTMSASWATSQTVNFYLMSDGNAKLTYFGTDNTIKRTANVGPGQDGTFSYEATTYFSGKDVTMVYVYNANTLAFLCSAKITVTSFLKNTHVSINSSMVQGSQFCSTEAARDPGLQAIIHIKSDPTTGELTHKKPNRTG